MRYQDLFVHLHFPHSIMEKSSVDKISFSKSLSKDFIVAINALDMQLTFSQGTYIHSTTIWAELISLVPPLLKDFFDDTDVTIYTDQVNADLKTLNYIPFLHIDDKARYSL